MVNIEDRIILKDLMSLKGQIPMQLKVLLKTIKVAEGKEHLKEEEMNKMDLEEDSRILQEDKTQKLTRNS